MGNDKDRQAKIGTTEWKMERKIGLMLEFRLKAYDKGKGKVKAQGKAKTNR